MIRRFYQEYLAPDKMLRHLFQHIEVAVLGVIILSFIIKTPLTVSDFLIFAVVSFAPDLDGVTSVFIWAWKIPMAAQTVQLLSQFKIKEALAYATVHHKQLNRLIFHNLIAYSIFWFFFISSIKNGSHTSSVILASLLSHFTFDLWDDLYHLGHWKNWSWPFRLLFPRLRLFSITEPDIIKPWKEYIPKKIRDILLVS